MPQDIISQDISKDQFGNILQSTGAFTHGANSTVGTSAVQLVVVSNLAAQGILVKAAATNTGKVYVGASTGVTASAADATDGLELSAGDSVLVEVDNANKVYVIASAAGQKVYWMAA